MSAIKKVGNLSQAHLDYIILALAKTSDLEEVKKGFQIFFETGVSGEVIMEVFSSNHDRVAELKDKIPFSEKSKDIRIADPVEQLRLLDQLYDLCLTPETVNITREGEHIQKTDKATALRCVDVASKIRISEMTIELKRLEIEANGDGTTHTASIEGEVSQPKRVGPVINIIHHREE